MSWQQLFAAKDRAERHYAHMHQVPRDQVSIDPEMIDVEGGVLVSLKFWKARIAS